jgi:hypothetical protein
MDDKNWNDQYDKKDYDKQIFSFRPQEIAKLAPWDAQIQMGAVAEKVLAGILRGEMLKRVGVKPSIDVGVEYDIISEKFSVYIPKVWCGACKNRRAEFSYANKFYCKDCAELIKQQISQKAEKAAEAKPEKPAKKAKAK